MKASTVRVAEANQAAVDHYKMMRSAVVNGSLLDKELCDLVVTSQLALLGHEVPFKIHAIKLFEMKVSREKLEQVILAGLGVTFLIPDVARTLDWISDAHNEYMASMTVA